MMHKFIPKVKGDYRANMSYWMYAGKNPLHHLVWHLGRELSELNGKTPEHQTR